MFQTFLLSPVVTATASLFSNLTSATHVSSVGVVRDSTVATAWVGHDSSCVAVSALLCSLFHSSALFLFLLCSLFHSSSLFLFLLLTLSLIFSLSLSLLLSLLFILFLSYTHTFTQNTAHAEHVWISLSFSLYDRYPYCISFYLISFCFYFAFFPL